MYKEIINFRDITSMRRLTSMAILTIALMMAIPAQAQFSWGVKGGVNLGNNDLTLLKDKEAVMNLGNYTGFFIGPKAEVRIPFLGFGVEAAALYAHKGMALTETETFKQNSFQIPLNIKYSFGLGNFANIFIAAGPEFGFNVGETSMLINNITVDEINNTTSGDVSAYIVDKSTLSINLGLGATLLNHVQVGVNYNMPWGKTGEFVYIDAEELNNAENIKNGENITIDNVKALSGTIDKARTIYDNIISGTIQISVAYLF